MNGRFDVFKTLAAESTHFRVESRSVTHNMAAQARELSLEPSL